MGDAGHGVPAPALAGVLAVCEEEAGKHGDDVGEHGDEDVGAVDAGEEGQVEEQQRSRQCPVDVAHPEDLSKNGFEGIWDAVLVVLAGEVVRIVCAAAGGHGEVGEGGDDDGEGGQDMEEPLLLSRG